MRTLLCKFKQQHFSVKNAIILCSFTFTAKDNRKSDLQLSNLQCCHLDIVILSVAIISNVQNVGLGRQTTPPLVDGVVHNRLVQFAPHGDQTLAQLVDVLVI